MFPNNTGDEPLEDNCLSFSIVGDGLVFRWLGYGWDFPY